MDAVSKTFKAYSPAAPPPTIAILQLEDIRPSNQTRYLSKDSAVRAASRN